MPTVLVIEDDRANREAFSKILTRAGFTVEGAENGLDGLDRIAQGSYQAVVCDISMPLLSGMGFFERLEEASPELAARVVFVTAYADDPRVLAFLKKTGQPVMEKPIELASLVEAVQQITAH